MKKYDFQKIETSLQSYWETNPYEQPAHFDPTKVVFSVLPPPNVTGQLHLGHALDSFLPDFICRFYKLQGFRVHWVPGMDHGGISTQAKVEKNIFNKTGKTRHDLGREQFISEINSWVKKSKSKITKQWQMLGLDFDYDFFPNKHYFTLDENLSKTVRKTFVDLYNQKLIVQRHTLVNWDPALQTVISNIEIKHESQKGRMFYFRYFVKNSSDFLVVATTRPETMFADVCLFVNPDDSRYKKYQGVSVINPVNGESIPVKSDHYVDINFGTGVMKCTPGHDWNDFELAKKHQLEIRNCFNYDGTMNSMGGKLQNQPFKKVREEIVKICSSKGTFEKVEDHNLEVAVSDRSGAIIEPIISRQWFLKTKKISSDIVNWLTKSNSENSVTIYPSRFNNTMQQWFEKMEDWCISRQLVWGHRLPVWYHKTTKKILVTIKPPSDLANWQQDEDVLDTWFSSALLPFSVPQATAYGRKHFDAFFPNSFLVSGYDIIFFWHARMILQSALNYSKIPFKELVIHGIIRDSKNRKMSKSLDNGIDPLQLSQEYGTDTVRWWLLKEATPGYDCRFDAIKLRAGWNFLNKFWNSWQFLKSLTAKSSSTEIHVFDYWMLSQLKKFEEEMNRHFEEYRFNLIAENLQNLIWHDFCDRYIELLKIRIASRETINYSLLVLIFRKLLRFLYPFCPFITQYIENKITNTKVRIEKDKIAIPKLQNTSAVELLLEIMAITQKIRTKYQIPKKHLIFCYFKAISKLELLKKYFLILGLEINTVADYSDWNPYPLSSGEVIFFNEKIIKSKADNKESLFKTKARLENEIMRIKKIFANPLFCQKASSQKIALEKEKLAKYESQLIIVSKRIVKGTKND